VLVPQDQMRQSHPMQAMYKSWPGVKMYPRNCPRSRGCYCVSSLLRCFEFYLTFSFRAEDKDCNRSIQALTEQNQRLRGMMSSSEANPRSTTSKLNARTLSTDDMINHPQKLMALVFPSQFISVVHTWDDICSPNRSQSFKLLEHGKLWTSWIHCAIYYPEFEAAHEDFWRFLELGGVVRQRNPSWLAIYYGLLAVR
jgi:hypothetical protein